MLNIFLAGGLEKNWRESAISLIYEKSLPFFYLSPSATLKSPPLYTDYDKDLLCQADVIIGYMTNDNPSGYGLCYELGVGKGMGCKTILVKEALSPEREKYFDYIRLSVDIALDYHDEVWFDIGRYLALHHRSLKRNPR